MITTLILQALFFIVVAIFWAGCGSFWNKYISDNYAITLSKSMMFTIHLVAPVLFLVIVVYSLPFKILNWAVGLKKEV